MKNNKSFIVSILLITIVTLASFIGSKKGEIVTFDLSIAEDATPAVLARVMQAKTDPLSEVKFEKGTYHFYPDKAFEKFCFISNHDDVMVRTAFPLFDFDGLTIDGQGSTFIFHGPMVPFLVDGSKNVVFKNLSIDWAMSFHSEALVVANDLKKKTFDIKISKEYPYEIRNEQLIFVKEYYEHSIGQSILYDPQRNAIAYDTESYTPLTSINRVAVQRYVNDISYKYKIDPRSPEMKDIGKEQSLRVEELEPGLVRIYNHRKKIPAVGMIFTAKGDQAVNRLAPAFRVTNTIGFDAQNINVHHAGGMGLIAENSENLILDNFNVTPSKGRMVSTTADATHFVGCRGKVVLKNCTFNNQLDDASNIHGTYQEVIDVIDEYTLGVRMGHSQQQGFVIGRTGDKIGLVRIEESFYPYDEITIQSIQPLNGRYQLITFNEKLPATIESGDLIENLDAYPDLLVENCNISGNRARGLLISNPKKSVIKNNYFSTEMEAILVPVESGHWYESGNAVDLTITGNTFQDCTHSGQNRGVIRFVPDDENENIAFKDVLIANNTFNHFDNLVLEIANTENLKFTKNTITNSGTFPMLFPENPAIRIKSSKEIVFEKNEYTGKADVMIETGKSMSDILFQ
ncbi:right-handed parallel beta-helix repeat-containing protein [Reichenbachiella carrageenanivorans]|uniref:Right-handed parallel beta-helix repeat-containing protein n=1 Tax=Reichenbachiella carrageenanivorans TaxID=2979869 RepID=A0ABY6D4M5_9BACT|nr:right-handed parallel beta-helix repeat-containing protein [Reichenbachiella carrageenanivorans]UXX81096.1 right-handed parallel beta-helix repeat-containing protein [Reichenbachiella carrageenanivorans]